jgi:hypothetical protein
METRRCVTSPTVGSGWVVVTMMVLAGVWCHLLS